LRLLFRKPKHLNASEAITPITAMGPANKHFSASAKS
jgi:hypothetical protein